MDRFQHVERGIAAQLAIRLDAPLVACNVGHDLDCFAAISTAETLNRICAVKGSARSVDNMGKLQPLRAWGEAFT